MYILPLLHMHPHTSHRYTPLHLLLYKYAANPNKILLQHTNTQTHYIFNNNHSHHYNCTSNYGVAVDVNQLSHWHVMWVHTTIPAD